MCSGECAHKITHRASGSEGRLGGPLSQVQSNFSGRLLLRHWCGCLNRWEGSSMVGFYVLMAKVPDRMRHRA
jgi:hypothetical protein